ncbi:D-allose-binding periplasmic protein precursor [Moorella thermoacetica]|uniref:sugar ABC transporter substrate-binding protein n=1 Tax=Neomoorella thermoacetica TaxID=1525 RepID=UPI00069E08F1|nr:sugar ABC transporter substrate-binding protein [Moorella thermoacetica]AKX93442.1 D-allose-binding periplasmic protein precursor [Moorella thermoacetica]
MSIYEKGMNRREFIVKSLMASGLVAGSSLLLSGCSSGSTGTTAKEGKRLKAAFSNAGLQATWCAQGKDTVERWGKWLGVDITWYDGALSVDKQRAAVEDMATKDWDFVAIQPLGIGTLNEPVKKMLERGIPVIDMDTMIAQPGELPITCFIAPDNVWGAEQVTEALMQAIGGKGNVVMTQGSLGHTGAQGRAQGFHNVIKRYPDVKVIDETPADFDVNKVAQIWENLLNRYDKIDAAYFHNDDMALAAYQVIKNAGREKEIKIGGNDGMQPAVEAIQKGIMVATARNSAPRIHWGALMIGYYAATEKDANKKIPPFILADGPIITYNVDQSNKQPWLNKGYGQSLAPGLIWQEDHFMV